MTQEGILWNRDLQQQIRSVESATSSFEGALWSLVVCPAVAMRCVEG